jgi:hypothetical protein
VVEGKCICFKIVLGPINVRAMGAIEATCKNTTLKK